MNKLITKEKLNIEDMIFEVRGESVILDSDLAKLYEVETKRINEAVKNNPLKFPERFSWVLTKEETILCSRSNFSTLNKEKIKRGQNIKYLPRVFTETGVAMLSTILKSKVAIETSIAIIDAFVAMRHYIGNNEYRLSNVEARLIEHDNKIIVHANKINLLEESFNKLEESREINEIYFDGKIYDAYSLVLDIFKQANHELIIVDMYTDKTLLDMIKNLECKVILITGKNSKITKLDIQKYSETYNNLSIFYNDTFHDRYFIIDRNKIYHSGNSINHIGFRKSSINALRDESIKNHIIKDLVNIIKSKKRVISDSSS